METFLSILVGIGLSAAVGLRVFLPFLIMSIAAMAGHLTLDAGFQWIGTKPALIAFSVAALLEILAFSIPWIDNFLDVAAQPVAMIAGVVATASVVTDESPLWKWSLAVIAGGGVAGVLQGGTALVRGGSTLTTGGLANFVVSALESGGAIVTSILAIGVPLLAILLVGGLLLWVSRLGLKLGFRRRAARLWFRTPR